MSEKLTGWFKPGTKPALKGVYQTRDKLTYGRTTFQHWDGQFWGMFAESAYKAKKYEADISRRQNPEWRGLAKKPEA